MDTIETQQSATANQIIKEVLLFIYLILFILFIHLFCLKYSYQMILLNLVLKLIFLFLSG